MKRNAKIEMAILGLAFAAGVAIVLSGCAVVTNDRVFPKLTWYWSADAKQQRESRKPLPVNTTNQTTTNKP